MPCMKKEFEFGDYIELAGDLALSGVTTTDGTYVVSATDRVDLPCRTKGNVIDVLRSNFGDKRAVG